VPPSAAGQNAEGGVDELAPGPRQGAPPISTHPHSLQQLHLNTDTSQTYAEPQEFVCRNLPPPPPQLKIADNGKTEKGSATGELVKKRGGRKDKINKKLEETRELGGGGGKGIFPPRARLWIRYCLQDPDKDSKCSRQLCILPHLPSYAFKLKRIVESSTTAVT
jgi:hypothetical protein